MNKLGFFTPVSFEGEVGFKESCLHWVDNYLAPFTNSVTVIKGTSVTFSMGKKSSFNLLSIPKIISYLFVPLPLSALLIKCILRSKYTFTLYDAEKELNKGINLDKEAVEKVKKAFAHIIYRNQDHLPELESISEVYSHFDFQMKSHPDLVFRFAKEDDSGRNSKPNPHVKVDNDRTEGKYRAMIRAKAICQARQLDCLEVPSAKRFSFNIDGHRYSVIAEKSMHISKGESKQKELLYKNAQKLNEAFRQMITFINLEGDHFGFIDRYNFFVMNEENSEGQAKVALLHLEELEMSCSKTLEPVLWMAPNRETYDFIADEIEQKTSKKRSSPSKKMEADWDNFDRLMKFYERNQIIDSKTPLNVDLNRLDLDLTKTFITKNRSSFTLKEVIKEVIQEINQHIANNPYNQGARDIRETFVSKDLFEGMGVTSEESLNIFQALQEKGYIFSIDDFGSLGFMVQA